MAHPLVPVLAVLALLAAGCSERGNEAGADGEVVPAAYQPFFFAGGVDDQEEKAALAALPYRAITLSRTSCFGPCPVYTVTFRNDLSASLLAEDNLDPPGASVGEVDFFDFGRLCYLADTAQMPALEARYRATWTDSATSTLTLTRTDGTQTVVSDYGSVGPVRLWALMEVIDHLRTQVAWMPAAAPAAPAQP